MVRSIYKRAYERRRRRKFIRFTTRLLLLLVVCWGLGWGYFVMTAPAPAAENQYPDNMDGVAVLTGSNGRVEAGLKALEAGHGSRMLISGINASLSDQTIYSAYSIGEDLASCCIDMGRKAQDTRGNAVEAITWANEHNMQSVLIITSDLHIRRAMLELRALAPQLQMHPYPVETDWKITASALEYSKYLISLVRIHLMS